MVWATGERVMDDIDVRYLWSMALYCVGLCGLLSLRGTVLLGRVSAGLWGGRGGHRSGRRAGNLVHIPYFSNGFIFNRDFGFWTVLLSKDKHDSLDSTLLLTTFKILPAQKLGRQCLP